MKVIQTKKGFLVSRSEYFGTPVFISAQTAEEINQDNVYIKFQTIWGKTSLKKLEQRFEEIGTPIEEDKELNAIFEKVCDSLNKRQDFDQEMANIEWEISMAVHRG